MEESWASKMALTVVIAITGARACDFIGRRLASFSNTFRTTCRVRFNSHTRCVNCQGFTHYSNMCTRPAMCRWCAVQHLTWTHTCPISTCRIRGRSCNHSTLKCVKYDGRHEAYDASCLSSHGNSDSDGEKEMAKIGRAHV